MSEDVLVDHVAVGRRSLLLEIALLPLSLLPLSLLLVPFNGIL
jgi:hypothetical protein